MINASVMPLPNRNALCLCGSGKKFKKCCQEKTSVQARQGVDGFSLNLQGAQAAVSAGNYINAERFFRIAVGIKPQDAVALAGLGQSLCQLNRRNEGIVFLDQAGKSLLKQVKKQGNFNDLLNLAYQLAHWHAHQQGLGYAQEVIKLSPGSANAHHIAALCLQRLNRLTQAIQHANRAVALAPAEANAIILLAILEAKTGKLTLAKARLEALLQQHGSADLVRVHKELGHILDKQGLYEQAFQHFNQSGELLRNSVQVSQLNQQAVYQDIAQFKAEFDPVFTSSTSERVSADHLPSPVFLIGFFRSGTTLAEQILAAHPEVITSDETHLIQPVLHELYQMTGVDKHLSLSARLKLLTAADIAQLRQFYWQTAQASLGVNVTQKVLIDKTALNILNIELINVIFPKSLLIFVQRDPRDICLSCFTQSFSLSPLTIHFLNWIETAKFYALISEYWLSVRNQLCLSWLELRYEAFLHDPQAQFQAVFAQLGLAWSDSCLEYYRHAQTKIIKTPSFDQVNKPLYHSSVGRWRNYEKFYAEVSTYLDRYISAFGYVD